MDRDVIIDWLAERDPERLALLARQADRVRRENVGDAVHLRGLVEWSNHCARQCRYCGIRAARTALPRYRLEDDEVMDAARRAVELGYGSLVLQAGEDPGLDRERVARVVRRVKTETPLAVTLGLGERDDADTEAWRRAGADRYLLRFETSDRELYSRLHPPRRSGEISDRIAQLRRLRGQGYEIGGGMMVGLPGQSFGSIADDLSLCRELDLDMIGIGPYLPDPNTPLGAAYLSADDAAGPFGPGATAEDREALAPLFPRFSRHAAHSRAGRDSTDSSKAGVDGRGDESVDGPVAGDTRLTLTVLSLARLLCPQANLPSTTALGVADPTGGRADGLTHGANVIMPNLTPARYRADYAIYPAKAAWRETAEAATESLESLLERLGRRPGLGPGGRARAL